MPLDPLGDEPITTPRPHRTAQFVVGDTVRIHAPKYPKWHNQIATILKVNPKRYRVETHVGKVNVPHTMVKEVTP